MKFVEMSVLTLPQSDWSNIFMTKWVSMSDCMRTSPPSLNTWHLGMDQILH